MIIAYTTIIIGFLFFVIAREKYLFHPIVVLYLIWGMIFVLCTINRYNYEYSEKSIFYIFLGLLACLAGYLFVSICRKDVENVDNSLAKDESFTISFSDQRKKIVIIFELIVLVILLGFVGNLISLLRANINYAVIRYSYLNSVINESGVARFLFSYLVRPFNLFLMPVSLYLVNIERCKANNIIFILELLNTILVTICMGERLTIFNFAIVFGLIFLIFQRTKKLKRRTKQVLSVGIIAFIVLFLGITFSRSDSDMNTTDASRLETIERTLYTYLSGCVPHFSYKLEQFDNNPDYTYGMTSFQGVVRPLYRLFVQSDNPESLFFKADKRREEIENAITIGGRYRYNGYISCFYYFYVDFGILGIIFLSFFVSIFINRRYYLMKQNFSFQNIVKYILVLEIFIFSFFQFMLSNLELPLAMVYAFFFLNVYFERGTIIIKKH